MAVFCFFGVLTFLGGSSCGSLYEAEKSTKVIFFDEKWRISENLSPMSPRKNACPQKTLGTIFLNSDSGLSAVFGSVPNVPKNFCQYPEEH